MKDEKELVKNYVELLEAKKITGIAMVYILDDKKEKGSYFVAKNGLGSCEIIGAIEILKNIYIEKMAEGDEE